MRPNDEGKIQEGNQPRDHEAQALFSSHLEAVAQKIDKMFAVLFVCQWLVGIAFAFLVSPRTWAGELSQVHIHVYAAIFIGGLIAVFPTYLALSRPGRPFNRYIISVSQLLFSILFIHLTGGRIETHFHVFGSIAFLAFYRDWRLLVTATVVTGLDHLLRGIFWPESVYGVIAATPWRALEHAAWVLFEDVVLFFAISNGRKEIHEMSKKQVELKSALVGAERATKTANTYRFALDSIAIVALTDQSGKITYANDNFCRISKYSRDELVGKTHRLVNSGAHPKSFFNDMWRTISSGLIWQGEIQNKAKDGSLYWVDTSIVPIFDKESGISGYLAARRDITAKKQLEHSLLETNVALERKVEERTRQFLDVQARLSSTAKMSALGEMAGGIAHEINNPLATIQTVSSQLSEIVTEKPLNESLAVSMCSQITETTERIAEIIRGLRSFSRDGSNDRYECVQVGRLIRETLSFCSERFRLHGVEVTVEVPEDLHLDARSTEVSQVMLNLFNNAYDAIQDLKEKWIHILARDLGEFIEIHVTDSGSGVPEEVREKIFLPFFTTKDVGKGTGLGLSISHGIVHGHGGEMILDSSCANTRFIVRLRKHQDLRDRQAV